MGSSAEQYGVGHELLTYFGRHMVSGILDEPQMTYDLRNAEKGALGESYNEYRKQQERTA
jgi:hypothetical protein